MKKALTNLPLAIAAVIALVGGGQSQAAIIGVATTPNPVEEYSIGAWVLGYSFTVNSPIAVTLLGVYDNNDYPLITSHDVGLWNSSRTLLASTIVPAGIATIRDQDYAFTSIAPVTLAVGATYTVGATDPLECESGCNDVWLENPVSLIVAPEITYVAREFIFDPGKLVEPTMSGYGTTGYFGGNFEFVPAAVPEPSSITLLVFGLVGLGFSLRRKTS